MENGRTLADVEVAPESARARVPTEHAARLCAGHFPGDPFLPGAYLAGLMAELATALVGAPPLRTIARCVFLARVRPREGIVVTATRAGARVEAEVHSEGVCVARATLEFGAGV